MLPTIAQVALLASPFSAQAQDIQEQVNKLTIPEGTESVRCDSISNIGSIGYYNSIIQNCFPYIEEYKDSGDFSERDFSDGVNFLRMLMNGLPEVYTNFYNDLDALVKRKYLFSDLVAYRTNSHKLSVDGDGATYESNNYDIQMSEQKKIKDFNQLDGDQFDRLYNLSGILYRQNIPLISIKALFHIMPPPEKQ